MRGAGVGLTRTKENDMTDRKDALTGLLAKVEAGIEPSTSDVLSWLVEINDSESSSCPEVFPAYRGSLDAAKALHEAFLPEYSWQLFEEDSGEFSSLVSKRANPKVYKEEWHALPARAWLIAILKALIAGEDTNDNDKGE
jgi:hypothetical protein